MVAGNIFCFGSLFAAVCMSKRFIIFDWVTTKTADDYASRLLATPKSPSIQEKKRRMMRRTF